ncbi:MAG: DUF2071 domain-containing protein [Planctomycetaceae bacterium]
MHIAFSRLDHRPWPVPNAAWTWRQNWKDLLFAHWPIPAAELQRLVPKGLRIQEFDGTSWIGVVPFRMTGVMRRPLPDLPGVSAFPELNLRIYVEYEGKPGVWFLSLDAANSLAVWGARTFFHLPYFLADITHRETSAGFEFKSSRQKTSERIDVTANYRPTSAPFEATPGTLEHFLVERYCLYAQSKDGRLFRGDVHHVPWPLQHAGGEVRAEALFKPHGLAIGSDAPLLHFSRGVDVVVWSLTQLR